MSATYAAVTTSRALARGDDDGRLVKMELVEAAPLASQRSNNQAESHEGERGRYTGTSIAAMLAAIAPSPPAAAAAVVTENEGAWRAAEAVARLFKRTKRANETFAAFARALRAVGGGCDIGEELYVTAFIAGIGDEFTAALLRVVTPQSLSSAAQEASRLRATDGAQKLKTAKKNRHQRERQQKQHHESTSGSVAQVTSLKPVLVPDDASPRRVEKCVKEAMKRAEPEAETNTLPSKKRRQACFACEQLGHIRRECPKRARLH